MRVDLHNHTTLCNHATGTMEEYVIGAIEAGIDVFGFSDHAPMDFDPHYRMRFDQMEAYEVQVHTLAQHYEGRIAIRLGYEIDYLPNHMDERVWARACDYRIGSVHFIDTWGFDNPEFIGRYASVDLDATYGRYFELIEAMARSGKFDIVGHLDLLKVFQFLPTRDIRLLARDALDAIQEANMCVEINVAGYRKPIGEAYPSYRLLEEIAQRDIPITFGSDAHTPEQVGLYRDQAEALARSVGYTQCATYIRRDRQMVTF